MWKQSYHFIWPYENHLKIMQLFYCFLEYDLWVMGGGSSGGSIISTVQRITVQQGELLSLSWGPELPVAMWGHQAVAEEHTGNIIITGGYIGNKYNVKVWVLDTISQMYDELPGMATLRHSHCSFILSNRLYVCGGQGDGLVDLFQMESINLGSPELGWKEESVPAPTKGKMTCSVVKDTVYIFQYIR